MQRSNGYLKGILKSGLLLVLSLSLFMDCDLGRPPARVQGPGERLAAINQPYIIQAIEDNNIPGISIAVVDAAQVIWLESFGVSSLESGQSNNPDRLHRLGPLSQTFVSFALHKLENEGALSLSDSLAEFFPETVETYLENITLKQILSHSSGIVGAQMLSLEPDPLIYRQALDYALRFPPDFPAGERFAFSSTGIEILGMVIEKVTGQDFSLYMDAEVLPPLGMAGGGFNLEGKTIIPGHNHGRSFEEYSHSLPIAGMVGSLNQLSDFLIKLSDISYGAGTSPWNKDDIDSIRDYRNGDLLWPTGAFIGLGSGILGHKIRSTGPVLGMEGGTFGSSAAFYYLPEEDMGIVYLSNNAGASPGFYASLILNRLFDIKNMRGIQKYEPPSRERAPQVQPLSGAQIAGRYYGYNFILDLKDGSSPGELITLGPEGELLRSEVDVTDREEGFFFILGNFGPDLPRLDAKILGLGEEKRIYHKNRGLHEHFLIAGTRAVEQRPNPNWAGTYRWTQGPLEVEAWEDEIMDWARRDDLILQVQGDFIFLGFNSDHRDKGIKRPYFALDERTIAQGAMNWLPGGRVMKILKKDGIWTLDYLGVEYQRTAP